jgi:hypothetical protein
VRGCPQISFDVPREWRIVDFFVFPDSSVLLAGEGGVLYRGNASREMMFINLTDTYGIEGIRTSISRGGACFDLDSDWYPEIFFFYPENGQFSKFYLNHPNGPFSDIATGLQIADLRDYRYFRFADLDGDYRTDLVLSCVDSSGNSIHTLLFNGATFEPFGMVPNTLISNREKMSGMSLTDYDLDGDLDIGLTFYYSPAVDAGTITMLQNSRWGTLNHVDTALHRATRGWNVAALWADVDNDGTSDLFLVGKWDTNALVMHHNQTWIDETASRLNPSTTSNSSIATAFDYDNDGDLDLFFNAVAQPLYVYNNNGKGFFKEVSNEVLPETLRKNRLVSIRSINTGDFNNDGFVDIVLAATMNNRPMNIILMNEQGRRFVERKSLGDLEEPAINETIVADVDNDGDLDIIGMREGSPVLWINTLNNNDYLKIRVVGGLSNTQGLGARIWIYEAGHLGDSLFLKGFRQIGSDAFAGNRQNDLTAHFGLVHGRSYDIKVAFEGGRSRILEHVSAGQAIEIRELDEISEVLYEVPGFFYRFFRQTEIQLYCLLFTVSMMVLYVGSRFGFRIFRWGLRFTVGLVVVNVTVFWLMLVLTANYIFGIKYLLPFGTTVFGTGMPIVISYWIRSIHRQKTTSTQQDELLRALIGFSHGEWAARNLNSLILLCSNAPDDVNQDERFITQFESRRKTFVDLTAPSIERILSLCERDELDDTIVAQLQSATTSGLELLSQQAPLDGKRLRTAALSLTQIKKTLPLISSRVYRVFSTDPVDVVKKVTELLSELFAENKVMVKRYKTYDSDYRVLITAYEFAEILDNVIRNAVRELARSEQRQLSVSLIRVAPRIHIDIKDSGGGVEKEKWETIFERGYSDRGSTGHGLFLARETLRKYGGRIFVRHSDPSGTTFTIELHEVQFQ